MSPASFAPSTAIEAPTSFAPPLQGSASFGAPVPGPHTLPAAMERMDSTASALPTQAVFPVTPHFADAATGGSPNLPVDAGSPASEESKENATALPAMERMIPTNESEAMNLSEERQCNMENMENMTMTYESIPKPSTTDAGYSKRCDAPPVRRSVYENQPSPPKADVMHGTTYRTPRRTLGELVPNLNSPSTFESIPVASKADEVANNHKCMVRK